MPPRSRALRAVIGATPRGKGFGNGRLVRNLFERAIERQATRIVAEGGHPADAALDVTDLELTTLIGADIVDAAPATTTEATETAGAEPTVPSDQPDPT